MTKHRRVRIAARHRMVAMVAGALVLFAGLPTVARASDAARATDPEPSEFTFGGESPFLQPGEAPTGDEVVGARSENTRTYETAIPGVYQTEMSATPLNYQVGGNWLPIDPALVETDDGYQNAANSVQIDLADSADDEAVAQLTLPSDDSVAFGLEGAEATEVSVDGDTATYEGALEGTDIELQSLPTGLKETLVLNSPSDPSVYSFPLATSGVTPSITEAGAVEFVDGSGNVKFVIPPGYMEDSSADEVGNPATSEAVTYTLTDGGQTLEVSLDEEWLTAPARVYPIMVDPTINIASDADDTFVANGTPTDRSAYYVLKAGYDGTWKYRSFLHFDTTSLEDMNVMAASFSAFQNGSGSCTASPMDVYAVEESWTGGSTTSWPGPDLDDEPSGTISSGVGHDSSCAGASVSTDVTRLVGSWADGSAINNGLALVARNETASADFKQFGSQESYVAPILEVLWSDPTDVSAPDLPANLSPNGEIDTTTPTFSADYDDPQADDGYIVFFAYDAGTGAFLSAAVTSVVDAGDPATLTATYVPPDLPLAYRAMAVDDVHGVPSAMTELVPYINPSIDLTAPSNGATVSGSITLTATLDSNVTSLTGVDFLIDGDVLSTDTSSPYSTSGATSSLSEGPHAITAVIDGGPLDGVMSQMITVVVDNNNQEGAPADEELVVGSDAETEAGATPEGWSGNWIRSSQTVQDIVNIDIAKFRHSHDRVWNGSWTYFKNASGARKAKASTSMPWNHVTDIFLGHADYSYRTHAKSTARASYHSDFLWCNGEDGDDFRLRNTLHSWSDGSWYARYIQSELCSGTHLVHHESTGTNPGF